MAWITGDLYNALENGNNATSNFQLAPGMCFVADNAYVKRRYMSVPFKGSVSVDQDAYNFFHSQVRITIERCFGVFVHRWSILRAPLNMPLCKIAPFVLCLCKLHNFCIDESSTDDSECMIETDARNILQSVRICNGRKRRGGRNNKIVLLNKAGCPSSILDGGMHFEDCPPANQRNYRGPNDTPMDLMFESVQQQGLLRPRLSTR